MWKKNFNTSYVTVQPAFLIHSCYCYKNFNTSYVTVQHAQMQPTITLYFYFNTSYVTVQRFVKLLEEIKQIEFEYILCYGLTSCFSFSRLFCNYISIHLMLRFNHICNSQGKWKLLISIHLMLRFNLIKISG